MKYSCDIVKDVIPLYYDEVCSDQTKKMVEEHLQECNACKAVMKKMGDNIYDKNLQQEKENVMDHYKNHIKKKLLLAGTGMMMMILLICLIVNIATSRSVDWFFLVLASLMVFASLTCTPFVAETKKRLWTFGCFTISLELLLLVCSIYSQGNWFWVAAVSTLLGLSVVFLPFVIEQIPVRGMMPKNKGVVLMAVDTVLLYALIVACGLYGGDAGYWKDALIITTAAVLFAWLLFAVIRYPKANKWTKAGICAIAIGIFSSLIHDIIYWTMEGIFHISLTDANFHIWNSDAMINANLYLILLLLGCMVGFFLLLAGFFCKQKQ